MLIRSAARVVFVMVMCGLLPIACAESPNWANTNLRAYLNGKSLPFSKVRSRHSFELPAVIAVGPIGEKSCVTIAFKRSVFDEGFLSSLSDIATGSVRSDLLPFTSPGIETVVDDENVFLKIHSGVIVHIRNDYAYATGKRVFKTDVLSGQISWVTGSVEIAHTDASVKAELRDFVVLPVSAPIEVRADQLKKDAGGGYTGTIKIDPARVAFPARLPPRFVRGLGHEARCTPR